MRVPDVGCGRAKAPAAVGVDVNRATDADVTPGAGRDGLPFGDGCFGRVHVNHTVEHVASPIALFEGIHCLHRPLGVSWFAGHFPEIRGFHLSGIFRARDIRFRLRMRWAAPGA